MDEDQRVALIKQKWGVESAKLMVTLPLPPLIRFIATSYKSVGTATGWALLLGDTGRPLLRELDRVERQLNYEMSELFG